MKVELTRARKKEKTTTLIAKNMRSMGALCHIKNPCQLAMKKVKRSGSQSSYMHKYNTKTK
jgi:hypothetical protein